MRSRRAVFSQIAGHSALDLANTVRWRLAPERVVDDLHDYDDVLRWSSQLGVISVEDENALRRSASVRASEAELESDAVRRMREALYDTLFMGGSPDALADEYSGVVTECRLARGATGWGWELPVELSLPRRRSALAAFSLLTRVDLTVLAQCQDAECGWIFLDNSPRRNRRWCVASDCGNRNRARDFYRRKNANS